MMEKLDKDIKTAIKNALKSDDKILNYIKMIKDTSKEIFK